MLKEKLQSLLEDLELPKGFKFFEIDSQKIFQVSNNSIEPFRYVEVEGAFGLAPELICYLVNENRSVEIRSPNGGVVSSKKVLIYPIVFNAFLNYSPEFVKDLVFQAVKQLERPDI